MTELLTQIQALLFDVAQVALSTLLLYAIKVGAEIVKDLRMRVRIWLGNGKANTLERLAVEAVQFAEQEGKNLGIADVAELARMRYLLAFRHVQAGLDKLKIKTFNADDIKATIEAAINQGYHKYFMESE